MIFIINSSGDITAAAPESVSRGSIDANEVILISPYRGSVGLRVQLPNKIVLEERNMSPLAELPLGFDSDGRRLYAYRTTVCAEMTQLSGTVGLQFFVTTEQTRLATRVCTFTVERGVSGIVTKLTDEERGAVEAFLAMARADEEEREEAEKERAEAEAKRTEAEAKRKSYVDGKDVADFSVTPRLDEEGGEVLGAYDFTVTFGDGSTKVAALRLPLDSLKITGVNDYVADDARMLKITFADGRELDCAFDEIFGGLEKLLSDCTSVTVGGEHVDVFDADTKQSVLDNTESHLTKAVVVGGGTRVMDMIDAQPTVIASAFIRRDSKGDFEVKEPTSNTNPATKKYVDDTATSLRSVLDNHAVRIVNLENPALAYEEDDSEAYEKLVPFDSLSYAVINSVGGATECVPTTENLFNPRMSGFPIYANEMYRDSGIPIVTDDGSFFVGRYFGGDTSVRSYEITLAGAIQLSPGTYCVSGYAEGANVWYDPEDGSIEAMPGEWEISVVADYHDGFAQVNGSSVITTYTDTSVTLRVIFTLPDTYSGNNDIHHNVYVMLNAGTAPLEFVKYKPALASAPVTKIVSYGRSGNNLFNKHLFPEETETGLKLTAVSTLATDITPEIFLSMTGLGAGDTFTISRTLGGDIADEAGYMRFFTSDSSAYVDIAANDAGYATYTVTLPEDFTSENYGKLTVYGCSYGIVELSDVVITKGDSAEEYSPYYVEIDSVEIPEAVRALSDYGDCYTTLDFDNKRFVNAGYTFSISEVSEFKKYVYLTYTGVHFGAGKPYTLDGYPLGSHISTENTVSQFYPTSPQTALWCGYNNSVLTYWIGILDNLGLTNYSEANQMNYFMLWLGGGTVNDAYDNAYDRRVRQQVQNDDIVSTDVSSLLSTYTDFLTVKVEPGGMLVFENGRGCAVPSKITYVKEAE